MRLSEKSLVRWLPAAIAVIAAVELSVPLWGSTSFWSIIDTATGGLRMLLSFGMIATAQSVSTAVISIAVTLTAIATIIIAVATRDDPARLWLKVAVVQAVQFSAVAAASISHSHVDVVRLAMPLAAVVAAFTLKSMSEKGAEADGRG